MALSIELLCWFDKAINSAELVVCFSIHPRKFHIHTNEFSPILFGPVVNSPMIHRLATTDINTGNDKIHAQVCPEFLRVLSFKK